MAQHLDARSLPEEGSSHGTECHASCCLAGARTLQDWPGIIPFVLLHSGEIRVTWSRPRQRSIAGQRFELSGVDWICRHDDRPLGPFGVADFDCDRTPECLSMADAPDDANLVALELHSSAASGSETSPREIKTDLCRCDLDMSRQPLCNRDESRSVRFTRG